MQQPAKKSGGAEKLEKRQSTENGNSKIAAFLPARQLWAWCGKGYRRSTGRVKKQFYKSIQRGKETISVSVGSNLFYVCLISASSVYYVHFVSATVQTNLHFQNT